MNTDSDKSDEGSADEQNPGKMMADTPDIGDNTSFGMTGTPNIASPTEDTSTSQVGAPTISTTNFSDKMCTIQLDPPSEIPTTEGATAKNGSATSNVIWLKKQGPDNRASLSKSLTQATSKMRSIKHWGINTFKCTKQMIAEQMHNSPRTIDPEIKASIETLREKQSRYLQLLNVARALKNHFYCVIQTQRLLGETLMGLVQDTPELEEELTHNSKTQILVANNGDTFLGALNLFISSLDTLCNKTMEDTLMTCKQIQFDAHPRSDINSIILSSPADSDSLQRIEAAKREHEEYKLKYERLKADVAVKMKLLEENKVQVLQRQLMLFQNACATCFTGALTLSQSQPNSEK
ncbi:arfaptin-2-like isoform X2 [Gigantopelta aegis]|uniref:arfaptin-2-like isoform X2 n=1 Tax=Gigantopelta aegis TaxID=1735272 RepID=UPI001B88E110|nr:arfaptin-2-like isoform X2 [Gigantopelta aegis]